ncbi:MAG: hypothetical protein OHK0045_05400 [Raineya sp.]
MRAESIGLRKYALFNDGGERVAILTYEGWLTYQAVAELENGKKIQFDSQGFWGQTIEVKEEQELLATIKMDWFGNVKIFQGKSENLLFTLKYTGFWQPKILLQDSKKNKIAEFIGHFKWSKFTYDYEIISFTKDVFEDIRNLLIAYFASMYLFRFISKSEV